MRPTLTTVVSVLTFAIGMLMPLRSEALQNSPYETYTTCSVGTVTSGGISSSTTSCWVEYFYIGTGYSDYSLKSVTELNGTSWIPVYAIQVPTYPTGELKVNSSGTKAWSPTLSCGDESELREHAVQAAAATVQGFPAFPVGHQITLFMPMGEKQTFVKISSSGSLQYAPVAGSSGECRAP